jgi:hypothetical protein
MAEHRTRLTPEQLAAFDAQIEKDTENWNGCWNWMGRKQTNGYGQLALASGGGLLLAHRISYMHYVGEIPRGKVIDHLCSNPACVNPNHLKLCTQRENVARAQVKRPFHRPKNPVKSRANQRFRGFWWPEEQVLYDHAVAEWAAAEGKTYTEKVIEILVEAVEKRRSEAA